MEFRLFLSAAAVFGVPVWCGAQGQSVDSQSLPAGTQLDASMAKVDAQGSVYVPLDNWVYSALDRLHALRYVDTAFLACGPGPG
jgi:hypothetical protein